MAGKLTFFVYRCTSPSGKSYVGFTGQTVARRWAQHVARSKTKIRHPFYAAIRKYGPDSFVLETVVSSGDRLSALAEEVRVIAETSPEYNISAGGEDDWVAGVARLKELCSDPEWFASYKLKLSEAVKSSEAHRARWAVLSEMAAQWRKDNPKKAHYLARRASRIAAKKARGTPRAKSVLHSREARDKMAKSQRERWASAPKSVKKKKSLTSKRATTEVWASRDESTRRAIAEKIGATMRASHANRTDSERAAHETQLAAARQKIDHDYRKARQKEALRAYWTPERRAEKAEKMRAVRLKQLQEKKDADV